MRELEGEVSPAWQKPTTPASRAMARCVGASVEDCPNCPANITGATGELGDCINPDHPPCSADWGDSDID